MGSNIIILRQNIYWGRGEEKENFGEENKDEKYVRGKNIKLYGTLYTPALRSRTSLMTTL